MSRCRAASSSGELGSDYHNENLPRVGSAGQPSDVSTRFLSFLPPLHLVHFSFILPSFIPRSVTFICHFAHSHTIYRQLREAAKVGKVTTLYTRGEDVDTAKILKAVLGDCIVSERAFDFSRFCCPRIHPHT
jgi:hypothetical protein